MRHFSRTQLALLGYFGLWIVYFALFWARALYYDERGNLIAGHVNIWGDWAAHFTMGTYAANHGLALSQSPFLINTTFSYPFVADWVSGWLLMQGVDLLSAFIVPSFLVSIGTVVALYVFYFQVFKKTSLALLSSVIFLFNGGVGFIYFLQDVVNSTHPWVTLFNPAHEYTRLDVQQLKWISVIDSMIIPQRAFAFGFPLTLTALALVLSALHSKSSSLKMMLGAGIILGLMPIIHTHSFLAAAIILGLWMVGDVVGHRKNIKELLLKWLVLGTTTLLIALPLWLQFFSEQVGGFIKWYPGWLAKEYGVNWIIFWIKNWGLTLGVAAVGLGMWHHRTVHQTHLMKWLFAPFVVIFILANLFLFQPFAWDNTKLISWASVGISAGAAYCLYTLWHKRLRFRLWPSRFKVVAVILFVVTVASGALDAYWIVRTDLHSFQMYSAEELALAEWVKMSTPADAVWLTGDQHNHFLFNLTGRRTLLTYRGWLWTHGYEYRPVEADALSFFNNPLQPELQQKYNIRYAVVGPNEREVWKANVQAFNSFLLIKETAKYRIYELPTAATATPSATTR